MINAHAAHVGVFIGLPRKQICYPTLVSVRDTMTSPAAVEDPLGTA